MLEGVDWIHLAQDKDPWRAAVNMVMTFQVPLLPPKKDAEFLD
jgi:hypothetical protein